MKMRNLSEALLVSTALTLTACSLTGQGNDGGDAPEIDLNIDNETGKATDAPTEEPEAAEDGLTVETSHLKVMSDEGDLLMTLSDSSFIYEDGLAEKYPGLAACLDDESGSRMAEMFDTGKRLGSECLDQRLEMGDFAGDMSYYEERETTVSRFDDSLMVIEDGTMMYFGGAHGLDTCRYTNIDVNTGEYITSAEIVKDSDRTGDLIVDALIKEYPDVAEVEWSQGDSGDPAEYVRGIIDEELEDSTLNCTITDEGFKVFFQPYELGSYAAGYMSVIIDTKDNEDCFNEKYITISNDRKDEVKYTSRDEDDLLVERPSTDICPECPSWDYFCMDGLKAEPLHTCIDEKSKTKHPDWFADDWFAEYGFLNPEMPYIDEYLWVFTPDMDEGYGMYQGLWLEYDPDGARYHYDLSKLANGPDEKTGEMSDGEMGPQFIRFAAEKDGFLYAELCYISYSADEPYSSYIAKIDMYSGEVLWKSEPLVANAHNFVLTDNAIICGYGFTNEDDYLYELDINTGKVVDKIKLDKQPEYIVMAGAVLYVWAYDTAYEFALSEG